MSEIRKVIIEESQYNFSVDKNLKTINGESLIGDGNIAVGKSVQNILFEGSVLVSINGTENILNLPSGWDKYCALLFTIEKTGDTPRSFSFTIPVTKNNNYSFYSQASNDYVAIGSMNWSMGTLSIRCGSTLAGAPWDNYPSDRNDEYYLRIVAGL